jgi:Transposase and inactivated derivatives
VQDTVTGEFLAILSAVLLLTCSSKLRRFKAFKCPQCGHSMPRDCNGALGIFLKALGDTANVDGSALNYYKQLSLHLPRTAGLDVSVNSRELTEDQFRIFVQQLGPLPRIYCN